MKTPREEAIEQFTYHLVIGISDALECGTAAKIYDTMNAEGSGGKASGSVSIKCFISKSRILIKAKASTSSKQAGESESSFSLEPELPGVSGETEGGENGR